MSSSQNTPKHPHDSDDNGFILARQSTNPKPNDADLAADVIRQKLQDIYADEPDALQEEKQAEVTEHRSKHQQFMYDLNHSGKDLAQVQIEWHNYYTALPDDEKHVVWQEFYASSSTTPRPQPHANGITKRRTELAGHTTAASTVVSTDTRSSEEIQESIRHTVKKRKKITRRQQNIRSILFGLSMGGVAVVLFLFSFFNEVIIAPFMQPSRTTTDIPLIVSADTVAPTDEPQVIIPKINVQIPLRMNAPSNSEEAMQEELDHGVVHYPTTAMPGQNGNTAIFGHSSNNIFNKGQYKFAFVLLHQMQIGDTFYITKDRTIYAYKIFDKKVVDPSEVGVLNPVDGHQATATLITCDPPGTTLKRLVLVGDQISPDINNNTAAPATATDPTASMDNLTSNGKTLLSRVMGTWFGKLAAIAIAFGLFMLLMKLTDPARRRR